MFGLKYEVLLYDLISTYFESSPPHSGEKRRYGYSRDKRSDCVQVVIALIVTPEGFPLAYAHIFAPGPGSGAYTPLSI
jgi:transposase